MVGAEGERKHSRGNQHIHGFSWMWDTNGAGMDLPQDGTAESGDAGGPVVLPVLGCRDCHGISNHSASFVEGFFFVCICYVTVSEGLWSSWEADGADSEQDWLPRE